MATAPDTLNDLIARWDSGEGKPYKGSLIDRADYRGDGDEPPSDLGCMCAQGHVLHLLGGWTPRRLMDAEQAEADRETAKLLHISVAHAILLRNVNDSVDGAPSIVLTAPEKVLGDRAHNVLAFWRHLDRMTSAQWDAVRAAAGDAEWTAAWDLAGAASWAAARAAAGDAAAVAALAAAGAAEWDAALAVARAAARASNEIQGARIMRERGQPFFFLPLFGFAEPEAVLAAEASA